METLLDSGVIISKSTTLSKFKSIALAKAQVNFIDLDTLIGLVV